MSSKNKNSVKKTNQSSQSNLLNNTCNIIRKGDNSSTAACSEKKIKKK